MAHGNRWPLVERFHRQRETRKWPQDDVVAANRAQLRTLIAMAGAHFSGPGFEEAHARLMNPEFAAERWRLLTPLRVRAGR